MKVEIEKLKNSEVKLTIELSDKEMLKYRKKAADALQSKVEIPGFRAGSIPLEMIERHLGEQAFLGNVMDIAISETYEEATKSEKIRPVAFPKINITSHDPIKYEATVPIVPEIKWKKDLKTLKVSPKKLEVTEAEIKEVLENLKKRAAKWKDVDRAAKLKDRVEIDFDGFDMDGVPLDGTSSKNHPVILGEGSLIPGFEDAVVGMKKGEEKDFEVTFPKDYHAKHFQSKKVKFHVKLNQIEEPEERKIDDEFAKEITGGNRKNLKELKEEIKSELMHQKEDQEKAEREAEFLKKLAEYVDADIPEALVDREKDFMIDRMKQDLEKRQVKWEDYEAEMKEKGKDIKEELDKPAREQVRIRLGIEKIQAEESIEVTEKELEAEIKHVLSHYPQQFAPMMEEKYKEGSEGREMVRNQVMLKKLVDRHTK